MVTKRKQEQRQPGNSVVNVIDVVPHTSWQEDFQWLPSEEERALFSRTSQIPSEWDTWMIRALLGMKPLWETLGYNTVASLFLFLVAPYYWYSRWNLGCSCIFSEPASQLLFIIWFPKMLIMKLHTLRFSWLWSKLSELSSQGWQTTPLISLLKPQWDLI